MTLKAICIMNLRFYAIDWFEFLGIKDDGSDRPRNEAAGDRHNRQFQQSAVTSESF